MMATQPKRRRSFRLSAEQRTQLRRARGKGSEYERVTPRADRSAFPLSSGQRRLWFLEQLEPGRTAYNMPAMVRLRGRLEVEVLRRALDEIFRRHEILRARFADERGEPRQII
ncbi:MAG: condensation domain-containing protein, partial [Acidobacteriota bacterium]